MLGSARVERYLRAVAVVEGRLSEAGMVISYYAADEWLDEAFDYTEGYFRDEDAYDEAKVAITHLEPRGRSYELLKALYLAYAKRTIRWIDGHVPKRARFEELFGICQEHGLDLAPFMAGPDQIVEMQRRDAYLRIVATALGSDKIFEAKTKRDQIRVRIELENKITRAYLGDDTQRNRTRAARVARREEREIQREREYQENEERWAEIGESSYDGPSSEAAK
jgi:hypothetical protein